MADEPAAGGDALPPEADPSATPAGSTDGAPGQPTPEEIAALQAARDAIAGLQDDVDSVVNSAASTEPEPVAPPPAGARAFELPDFAPNLTPAQAKAIDLLSDVNLNVKIELGRTRMYVEDVLRLNEGAVVELDKLAGDPVDVYVNDRHVARGEVLVLNDNFCVRINEIIKSSGDEAPGA
ncbi:MAG: flagellar motor switch protein FliN [Planctomycetota bacterium]|nr:flagellar motor switch protein FliN [Planctomycetota bacterium]